MKDLIVFDMDGVLVDVTESYRAAVQATVRHFTRTEPTNDDIQEWKNRGGFNDDFKLSHHMIRARGRVIPYQTVVDRFQKFFHGNGSDGLILREKWLAAEGLFERLRASCRLAVFTGRYRWEAEITLKRFLPGVFELVVGADDVTRGKPDPEGLLGIRRALPEGRCWYVGDTVDDARASKAAEIPFIGIASPQTPRYCDVVKLLRSEGAIAVLDDINSLESTIAQSR